MMDPTMVDGDETNNIPTQADEMDETIDRMTASFEQLQYQLELALEEAETAESWEDVQKSVIRVLKALM